MRLPGGPHFVPHLGRAWPENGEGLRLAAESGRTGMDSTHGHSAVRRSTTARRRQGRALSCYQPPATTRVGNKAMRAAACDPIPIVVCGWPRRTYCRPCSRLSASPAGHATLLPWLAPQQHTRLRALGLATPAVAVDAQQVKQRTCSSARAARGRGCRIKSGVACRGSWFSPSRGSGVLAQSSGE